MDPPTDILSIVDGGKALDSDSTIREHLDHSELFEESLAGIKDHDDDSVESLPRKKMRLGDSNDGIEGTEKSPLASHGSIDKEYSSLTFKTELDRPSDSPIDNILGRSETHVDSSSANFMTNPNLDTSHASSDRVILGMGATDDSMSPSFAPQPCRRAKVFGIGFMQVQTNHWQSQGSPLRDAASAGQEHQPLPLNDPRDARSGDSILDQAFDLDCSVGHDKKNDMHVVDTHQTSHYSHDEKNLPRLDSSRASLDHPDDDRLVAADTEEPYSVHGPIDFHGPDSQANQPISIDSMNMHNGGTHQDPMHPMIVTQSSNHKISPQFSQNQILCPYGPITPQMVPFNNMMFPSFPTPSMQGTNMAQQLFGTGGITRLPLPPQQPSTTRPATVKAGVPLALSCDEEQLSEYQVLIRNQLEIFEASKEDVESNTQGRKKPVYLGQVGIRCRHCAAFPLRQRGRGAVYFPARLQGVYQAAQNMASTHLCESCQCIPPTIRQQLQVLRDRRDTAGGGKQYWADGARALGLQETKNGLRIKRKGET